MEKGGVCAARVQRAPHKQPNFSQTAKFTETLIKSALAGFNQRFLNMAGMGFIHPKSGPSPLSEGHSPVYGSSGASTSASGRLIFRVALLRNGYFRTTSRVMAR